MRIPGLRGRELKRRQKEGKIKRGHHIIKKVGLGRNEKRGCPKAENQRGRDGSWGVSHSAGKGGKKLVPVLLRVGDRGGEG